MTWKPQFSRYSWIFPSGPVVSVHRRLSIPSWSCPSTRDPWRYSCFQCSTRTRGSTYLPRKVLSFSPSTWELHRFPVFSGNRDLPLKTGKKPPVHVPNWKDPHSLCSRTEDLFYGKSNQCSRPNRHDRTFSSHRPGYYSWYLSRSAWPGRHRQYTSCENGWRRFATVRLTNTCPHPSILLSNEYNNPASFEVCRQTRRNLPMANSVQPIVRILISRKRSSNYNQTNPQTKSHNFHYTINVTAPIPVLLFPRQSHR